MLYNSTKLNGVCNYKHNYLPVFISEATDEVSFIIPKQREKQWKTVNYGQKMHFLQIALQLFNVKNVKYVSIVFVSILTQMISKFGDEETLAIM